MREFLIRYQDRVLYGTDLGFMPGEDAAKAARKFEDRYARDWAYFATAETIEHEGRKITGLALPDPSCGACSARTPSGGCRVS